MIVTSLKGVIAQMREVDHEVDGSFGDSGVYEKAQKESSGTIHVFPVRQRKNLLTTCRIVRALTRSFIH